MVTYSERERKNDDHVVVAWICCVDIEVTAQTRRRATNEMYKSHVFYEFSVVELASLLWMGDVLQFCFFCI